MAFVRVKEKVAIQVNGVIYTAESGEIELDDDAARGVAHLVEFVEKPKKKKSKSSTLSDLASVTPALVSELVKNKIKTVEELSLASIDELVEIKGIGRATAKKVKKEARELLKG